jgi:hypothetical protein
MTPSPHRICAGFYTSTPWRHTKHTAGLRSATNAMYYLGPIGPIPLPPPRAAATIEGVDVESRKHRRLA